jgi:hypothetical protein
MALSDIGSSAGIGAAVGSVVPGLGTGLGLAIGAGIGGLKALFGGWQALKGQKDMNSLLKNRPQYNISQGYQDAFKTYQSLANSNLPGYDIMQGQINQSGAKAMDYASKGAMGSNQYMSAALQSQDKELDAIRNLGLMSAQWRGQQKQNLAGAENQIGQLQDQQWQQNVLEPWNIRANIAGENRQAGMQNLFGGLQEAGSSLLNYAGTSAMLNMYKNMNKQGNGFGSGAATTSQTSA